MDALFVAELRDIKIVYNVLKALSFKETAIVRAMNEGLKVTVEEMRSVQTSAYIPNDVFTSYNLFGEDVLFKIKIKCLTECLNIFGDDGNPGLKIVYKEIGAPLMLILDHDEENITVDCKISTMEADDMLDLNLADECNVNNVVVKANSFVTLLHELDVTSDELELVLSKNDPFFQMSTSGLMGEALVEVAPTSEMVEVWRCKSTSRHRYNLTHVKQLEKVMAHANKVSISTGQTGLLGIQLAIDASDGRKMFVDYYCTPLIDSE